MVLSSREEPVIIYYLGDGKERGVGGFFRGHPIVFREHGGGGRNRHPQSIEVGLNKIDCQ